MTGQLVAHNRASRFHSPTRCVQFVSLSYLRAGLAFVDRASRARINYIEYSQVSLVEADRARPAQPSRHVSCFNDGTLKVRLTRKLANCLDGVDVSGHKVGDVFELSLPQAQLLIAEAWALHERRGEHRPPPLVERRRPGAHPQHTDLR